MTTRRVRVYTRTGDNGTSSLYTGERREKHDKVFEALGTTDELNSFVGVARAAVKEGGLHTVESELAMIQSALLDLGSHVATPRGEGSARRQAKTVFAEHGAGRLEAWIDAHDETLPPLSSFVLPGGGPMSAHLHVCRSVTRRLERRLVPLGDAVDGAAHRFVNRLSDYFFVVARVASQAAGDVDETYQPGEWTKTIEEGHEAVEESH